MNARFAACLATAVLLLTSCSASDDAAPHDAGTGAPAGGVGATTELERTLEQLLVRDGCVAHHARELSSTDAFVALLLPPATTATTLPCPTSNSKGP